jgi:peptidyl-prolyl cis-trans isomerase C
MVSAGLFAQADATTIVAAVNGTELTAIDVRREMNMMYQQAVMQGVYPDESEIDAYWNRAIEVLIGRELLLQAAESKNYTADSAAVEEYINGLTINYGGIEALTDALAEQGMTLEKLRNDTLRYQIISLFVEKELRSDVVLDDSAALQYYNENKEYFQKDETINASHILVQTSENADETELEAAYTKISALYDRVAAGEDFAELAREYSDCPSAENGGDLGEFGHGMMVPPFDRAAFDLEPGEFSKPVQTQFGYHIILLTAKNAPVTINFEDVQQQITDYLVDSEVEQKVNSYVSALRDEADIKLY